MRRLPFFFNDTATTEIYTLSLHDALPIFSFSLLMRLKIICLASLFKEGMSNEKSNLGVAGVPVIFIRQLTRTLFAVKLCPIFKSDKLTAGTTYCAFKSSAAA